MQLKEPFLRGDMCRSGTFKDFGSVPFPLVSEVTGAKMNPTGQKISYQVDSPIFTFVEKTHNCSIGGANVWHTECISLLLYGLNWAACGCLTLLISRAQYNQKICHNGSCWTHSNLTFCPLYYQFSAVLNSCTRCGIHWCPWYWNYAKKTRSIFSSISTFPNSSNHRTNMSTSEIFCNLNFYAWSTWSSSPSPIPLPDLPV